MIQIPRFRRPAVSACAGLVSLAAGSAILVGCGDEPEIEYERPPEQEAGQYPPPNPNSPYNRPGQQQGQGQQGQGG